MATLAYNDRNHAQPAFFASDVSGKQENEDVDGYRGDCKAKFGLLRVLAGDNDNELDGEAKEEEEVEFK